MKRFIVPLFAVLLSSSCGSALDGSWSTPQLRDDDEFAVKYTLVFSGPEVTVKTECKFGRGSDELTYRSKGRGPIKLVEDAFVVTEPINLIGEYSWSDRCEWTFRAQSYAYRLSGDYSTLRVYFDDDAYLDFYRD